MSFYDLLKNLHPHEDPLTQKTRREPRFLPEHHHESSIHTPPLSQSTFKPERLLPVEAEPASGGDVVKGTTKPLLRREIYADPSLGGYFTFSLLTHCLIIFALTYQASQKQHVGNPQVANNSPVEMIFSQPPATSGMAGPQSPEAGSGNEAPTQTTVSTPTKESAPKPTQPQQTPQTTTSPQNQEPQNGEISPTPQAPSTTAPLVPKHGPKSEKKPTQNYASLLNHPQEYSLNQASAPPRPQKTRPGGSTAPMDLSVGPIVQNGKINAHYSSRTAVHGVSSDYAAELDAWIQRHLYYPPDAAERGEEGDSSVHVVLERSGRVKNVWETQGATDTLNAATVGMFTNAQLPPVPPDMKDKVINFDLTVNYILIRN